MKTALIVIATGSAYHAYARELIWSAKQFFLPHDSFLWTDSANWFPVTHQFHIEGRGYPNETLYRYHTILAAKDILNTYDQIFYVDADMRFVHPVGEISSEGITATLHPGYFVQNRGGSPELNSRSKAYCRHLKQYFCGGFNGGNAQAYLAMAENIQQAVDEDMSNGIVARWHDESHLNRYLHFLPPTKILTPSYCFPEGAEQKGYCGWTAEQCPPILVALTKGKK